MPVLAASPKMPPSLIAALDRFASVTGGRLRLASEILAGARGDPLTANERRFFNGAVQWWSKD